MNATKIAMALKANTPVLIWGPPGVGKTAAIAALARETGKHLETVIASVREPSDFSGLPVISDDGVRFAPPVWARRLIEHNGGILFLDEISTAPPAVQAALLRVVLDRAVGDVVLPKSTIIIAAANPPEMAAGGWDLTPPLANRFVHLNWEVKAAEWAEEFPSYWGHPPQLDGIDESQWAKARVDVAAFVHVRPQCLLQLPKDESEQGRAWPSPRSWDHASRVLAICYADGLEPADVAEWLVGAVGTIAYEFIQWRKELDLPAPADVLAKPDTFPLPERPDALYATLAAVAEYAIAEGTEAMWHAAWKVLARAKYMDMAAAMARRLGRERKNGWRVPKEAIAFADLQKKAGLWLGG